MYCALIGDAKWPPKAIGLPYYFKKSKIASLSTQHHGPREFLVYNVSKGTGIKSFTSPSV